MNIILYGKTGREEKINSANNLMMDDIKDKIACVVVSCDKYSDLWKPFFTQLKRHWRDCPFKIYLISNTKGCESEGIINILVGEDKSWSESLKNGLNFIGEEYIFMQLDDLFLVKKVDDKLLDDLFGWAIMNHVNYLRLNAKPKPNRKINDYIGEISKGSLYRTATIASLWKRSTLMDLLKNGENAWEFEIKGSYRSDAYDGFYSTHETHFQIMNCVIKGKWERSAYKTCKENGIDIDISTRPLMTHKEFIFHLIGKLRSNLFNYFPWKYRRKMRSVLAGRWN